MIILCLFDEINALSRKKSPLYTGVKKNLAVKEVNDSFIHLNSSVHFINSTPLKLTN